jgi:hypothetical protein
MVMTAAAEFQAQIEKMRREAFEAGYAAAMQAVEELASQPTRNSSRTAAAPNDRRRGRSGQAAAKPNGPRRARVNAASKATRRSVVGKSQRGANALRVQEVLKATSPRAVRPAAIRKALQEKGITISFPSLRHALRQLAARKAAMQVGNTRTWRYRGST